MQMLKGKIRKVGTSFGVIIPKEQLDKEKVKEGDDINFSFAKRRNIEQLFKLMGTAREASSFERERNEREF